MVPHTRLYLHHAVVIYNSSHLCYIIPEFYIILPKIYVYVSVTSFNTKCMNLMWGINPVSQCGSQIRVALYPGGNTLILSYTFDITRLFKIVFYICSLSLSMYLSHRSTYLGFRRLHVGCFNVDICGASDAQMVHQRLGGGQTCICLLAPNI